MTKLKALPTLVEMPRPNFVLLMQQKSSAKTTTSVMLLDAALRSKLDIRILENDPQTRLEPYGQRAQIKVADQGEIMTNDLADFDSHQRLIDHIGWLKDRPDGFLLYDSAAGGAKLLPAIMDELGINELLVAVGAVALVAIPLTVRFDLAEAALETFCAIESVLPHARVVPVVAFRDGHPSTVPPDHPFWKVIGMAKHGVLQHPELNTQLMLSMENLRLPLSTAALHSAETPIEGLAETLGTSSGRAYLVASQCRKIVVAMNDQLSKLGFRPAV